MSANDLYKVRGMMREAYETVRQELLRPILSRARLGSALSRIRREVEERIDDELGLTLVAAFLGGLNDSHTSFLPPPHSYTIDYGYHLMVVGDNVVVERVRPGTDAASKGAAREISSCRSTAAASAANSFRRMWYLFHILQPQPTTRLELRDPSGAERVVTVTTTVTPGRAVRNLTGPGARHGDPASSAEWRPRRGARASATWNEPA